MGISFKVSKKGIRFRPKPVQIEKILEECSHDSKPNLNSPVVVQAELASNSVKNPEDDVIETGEDAAGISGSSSCSGGHISSAEAEVSFTLNLYQDGYFIGKPSEAPVQDAPKSLHPYDRTSETIFSAIESGRLPGDILDDIPSKYLDGMLVCEVRDYRKSASVPVCGVSSVDQSPIVNRISLRMSLENVVKDMPLISDESWTYSDLMEVESRILKALQPQLCLDPTPMLDRLCSNPGNTKLNLGLCGSRKRRLRKMPEVTIISNNQTLGKKVCIDKVQEISNSRLGDSGTLSGDNAPQHIRDNMNAHALTNTQPLRSKNLVPDASTPPLSLLSKHQQGVGYPRAMQDHYSGSAMNPGGASPSARDFAVSYSEGGGGKRENQDAPLTPSSKRGRQTFVGLDGIQRQHSGSQLDSLPDISWNNSGVHPHTDPRGVQYANNGGQKYTQKVFEGVPNQDASMSFFNMDHQGNRYTIKDEQTETEKVDKTDMERSRNDPRILEVANSQMDPQQSRLQQRLPQNPSVRSHFPQTQWHNLGQSVDNDPRRKLAQSPRVSSIPIVQSPVSSKSGDFSSGSFGQHFNAVSTSNTFGPSQKEKTGATSAAALGGPSSVTSSPSDSFQRQHQGQMVPKRRSNSVPRTPAMSGVGSPASVGNMMVPMNANSPSLSNTTSSDQMILERFSKIEMLTLRHQLNSKKNKVDEYPARKPMANSPQLLASHLSNTQNNEDHIDMTCKSPISKSLIGGNMNVPKMRALIFEQGERRLQGNVFSNVLRSKFILSEKQSDGTVAMLYGNVDDVDLSGVEDYLPALPNSHHADILAAQFCSLMVRDGYQVINDQIRPKQTLAVPSNQPTTPSNGMSAEMQQSDSSNAVPTPLISGNSSLNNSHGHQNNTWAALPPGNNQNLHMSNSTRPMDAQLSIQQQQQQNQHALMQQHAQRSSLLPSANPLSQLNAAIAQNSNVQLGNHMMNNKPSHSQIQMLHHQQQQPLQQQQQQMQRKLMMGLGTAMNIGNMGQNVVGLGGLGNVLGTGGARGIGGPGQSGPGPGLASSMGGPISGITNMNQNPMNATNVSNLISQQLRNGKLIHAQAAAAMASKRLMQTQGRMAGGPQSGLGNISGTGQIHPGSSSLSMLGQTLNRSNINNPMQQRTTANIASMGPPKMIPGTNFYMNQQQQQQLQLQAHQQQQLQQQAQHIQQMGSPLQAVVSSPQVGSPLQAQQQFSPQQMNQPSPMSPRLSSGSLPPLNAGNMGPGSPQLSGSITSSSMDLQGVNKSNSASNMQG